MTNNALRRRTPICAFLAVVFLVLSVPRGAVRTVSLEEELRRAWLDEYAYLASSNRPRLTRGTGYGENLLSEEALIFTTDRTPLDIVYRRTAALHREISAMAGARDLSVEAGLLAALKTRIDAANTSDSAAVRDLFLELCAVRRSVALANPLLDFGKLLVLRRGQGVARDGSMWGQQAEFDNQHIQNGSASGNLEGGGIFEITGIGTDSVVMKDVLENSVIENGPLQGRRISDFAGVFRWYDLHWDGRRITFSWAQGSYRSGKGPWYWVHGVAPEYNNEYAIYDTTAGHIFTVNTDGTNLRQLTTGPRDDLDPIWLPGGRIAFMSNRDLMTVRCGQSPPQTVLYSMKQDGSDLYRISYHETNERMPSVTTDGLIAYTRWDYIDRHFVAAHHLWLCYPDGRDPRAPHGNYAHFPGKGKPGRRPMSELYVRSIPGAANKFIATMGSHHSMIDWGYPIEIDVSVRDDCANAQTTRLLPDWGRLRYTGDSERAESDFMRLMYPWPLSERFYLAGQRSTSGRVFLMDAHGNRELVALTPVEAPFPPDEVALVHARPLRAETMPPSLPFKTYEGERRGLAEHTAAATISVSNVYETDEMWKLPDGIKITHMRIIQLVPKPYYPFQKNDPSIGHDDEQLVRVVLGVVPVEDDGSVYCEAPINAGLAFQLLDSRGVAIQGMKSLTYAHRGEHLSCTGCHEDKWKTVSPSRPTAMSRAPSRIEPELDRRNYHLTSYGTVRGLFEQKCLPCHTAEGKDPLDFSHGALKPYLWVNNKDTWSSKPMAMYALGSRLGQAVLGTAHQARLTREEIRRVTLWLDCNSPRLCSYTKNSADMARQTRGDGRVWPVSTGGVFPWNPTSVEIFPDDNQAPGAAANITATDSPRSDEFVDVALRWDGATDNNAGVVCYAVYRDSVFVDHVPATSFVDPGIEAETRYTYEVQAIDRAGNRGARTPLAYTTSADRTPPGVWRITLGYVDTVLQLSFTEELDRTSAETATNYTLSNGATVVGARLLTGGRVVELKLRGIQDGQGYTLTAASVADAAASPNAMQEQRWDFATAFPPPVSYKYYELASSPASLADFDTIAPVKTGAAAGIDLSPAARPSNFALRFTGTITVTEEGPHTFYIRSDDGSVLWIDGDTVVSNDGLHGASEKAGSVVLARGEHTFEAGYFNAGGDRSLEVLYSASGPSRQPLASATVVVWQVDFQPGPITGTARPPASLARAKAVPIRFLRGPRGEISAVILRAPLGQTVRATLELVDLSGRVVQRYSGNLRDGETRHVGVGLAGKSPHPLAPGMYPCRIRVGNTERQLTILRLPR